MSGVASTYIIIIIIIIIIVIQAWDPSGIFVQITQTKAEAPTNNDRCEVVALNETQNPSSFCDRIAAISKKLGVGGNGEER